MQDNLLFNNIIISDTTCLIHFKNINKLDLLKDLFRNITITPEIEDEYNKGSKDKLPEWVQIKKVNNTDIIKKVQEEGRIHFGEATAIALAIETKRSLLIIDDFNGREYAYKSGLMMTGTFGIVKLAREENIIKTDKEANIIFKKLKDDNFRISDKLMDDFTYEEH